ncbi:pantoate--beta-alanine ligase [Sporosarcina sp. FA9]|uniref:pantoate--beta-alanine ligase n=1 Tax=Sporosarcina sp. FA9 TaxID=3413030 RepID=UPI003F6583D2
MKTIYTIQTLHQSLNQIKKASKTIGFVPTMGFLHEGHLALVEKAKQETDIVVMSIFVNPAQFGPGEDFEAYPRNTKRDMELASNAGVDILFVPETVEMYPTNGGIRILPGPQATKLCGASRPEHFDGVLKVVLKLFNIVDPDRSYFGMKDAQQFAIIENFIRDFNLRTELVRVATVREKDGLAKSSRNVNLSESERLQAPEIQKALQKGLELFKIGLPVKEIEIEVIRHIVSNSSGSIDYVSLLSYPTLQEFNEETKEAILACAVKFENTRLIDNIIFSTKDE